MKLRDQVVVVTGASSGFGEAIARAVVAEGARVVLAARTTAKLEQLAVELGADRVLVAPTDVTRAEDVERLAATAIAHFGHVDALVNNAGFGVLDRFVDTRIEDLQEMIDVNVYGAVRCTQVFLPHLLARGSGQIVFMDSLAGLFTTTNFAFYAATKHALAAIARALMIELGGTGVTCALVCPNVALTGFQQRAEMVKYGRLSRLIGWTTSAAVARATVRTLARRTNAEVLVPWTARLLYVVYVVSPRLSNALIRWID